MNFKNVEEFSAQHPTAFTILVGVVSCGMLAVGGLVVSLVSLFAQ